MKKLALFIFLAIAAPMLAVISDTDYAKEVQNLQSALEETYSANNQFAQTQTDNDQKLLLHFMRAENLPAAEYLFTIKAVNPLNALYNANKLSTIQFILDHAKYTNSDIDAAIKHVQDLSDTTSPVAPEREKHMQEYKERIDLLKSYKKIKLQ